MLGNHRAVIHLVDVITSEYEHILGLVVTDDIQVLVHGIGGAFVPRRLNPLLRWQQLDELPEFATQKPPAPLHVQYQGVGLVLGQDAYPANTRVHAVGQWEVDDAELAAERRRRLRSPQGELPEAGTSAAGEDQRKRVAGEATYETRVTALGHGRQIAPCS